MLGCSVFEEWNDFYSLISSDLPQNQITSNIQLKITEVSIPVKNLKKSGKCTDNILIKCSWKGNVDFVD